MSASSEVPISHPNGHFYSPVTDPAELEQRLAQLYPTAPEAPGIDFNDFAHTELLGTVFPPLLRDYDYPEEGSSDCELTRFYTRNSQFSWLDSRALFALMRHWQPRRVIEVGSGYSSLLMADVNRRFLGSRSRITCIEPYPRPFLSSPESGIDLIAQKVQDVEIAEFAQLEANDLLFIDSSHVCKTGSDVTYLYLQVLPRLKRGVRVHVHDIFLPCEYPVDWVIGQNRSWNEQYLLQAMLMFSTRFRVLLGANYAQLRFPQLVARALAHPRGIGYGGGSFYFEVV